MMSYLNIPVRPAHQQQKVNHSSHHRSLLCKRRNNACRVEVPLAEESHRLSLNMMDQEADIQGFFRIVDI